MPDARNHHYGRSRILILTSLTMTARNLPRPLSDAHLRTRLSLLYFLQFAVWGCYLTCFSQLLGAGGLGRHIAWFYSAIGLVSLFTPALMGHLADRHSAGPVRLLAVCHFAAAIAMGGAWLYASSHRQMEFAPMFALYVLFLAFFMPTLALVNTTAFGLIKSRGKEPVDVFPAIRVWGTVGFVAAMWFVNSAWWHDGAMGFTLSDTHPMARFRFQYTSMQLLATAVTGIAASAYALTLPRAPRPEASGMTRSGIALLSPAVLRPFLADRQVRIFLIFAALSGVCLQISNGFATPFITHFSGMPEYAGLFASGNATMLFSLSQISEAVFILVVGLAMSRLGIRRVIAIALVAWAARFALFGFGNPGHGLWMLTLSMIVYGVAFNFFTIAGHLYMEKVSSGASKGLGQGVMMLASNGIGATLGTLAAGGIVNHWCSWQMVPSPGGQGMVRLFMGEWIWPWLIFALYALATGVLFYVCFRPHSAKSQDLR